MRKGVNQAVMNALNPMLLIKKYCLFCRTLYDSISIIKCQICSLTIMLNNLSKSLSKKTCVNYK